MTPPFGTRSPDATNGPSAAVPTSTVDRLRPMLALAELEIRRMRRSRFVLAFTLAFVLAGWRVASIVRPMAGDDGARMHRYTYLQQPETHDAVYAVSGYASYSFHVTSFVFLVPLFGLLLGYGSIVRPRTTGSLKTVVALPCSRATILLGTFLGRGLILAGVIGSGLLVGWLTITPRFETAHAASYAAFSLVTIGYGLVWLSIGFALSSMFSTARRVAAVVFTVFVGFTFNWHEIAIDLLGLFPTAYVADPLQAYLIVVSAPYDELVPKLHLASHEDIDGFGANVFGPDVADVAADVPIYFTWPVAALILLVWILAPLALTYNRLRRMTLT